MFWKRKKQAEPKKPVINYDVLMSKFEKDNLEKINEPWTLAKARLEGGAKDTGANFARKMYNSHKAKLQNQWINPLQSVNTGFGTSQLSLFCYQPVNYYECYSLAQDPIFAKVFNLLSEAPFAKGGILADDGLNDEQNNEIEKAAKKYDVWFHIREAVRSSYVTGGCLLYMDFGLSEEELREPLDLKHINMKKFKGFRHIDPINCVAVNVNTVNPTASDYMKPSIWYVIGLGSVHKSHFLQFDANLPELPMRPLTLYFGMPLTQLIKQDVANSNLASQGLANLMNRFRNVYLTTDDSNFVTDNVTQFKAKLQFMSFIQDNFSVCPLKSTEGVTQLTTSMAGMAENVEMFYLLISAKTDIPYTELMGKSAEGMNATGSGDRRKWYDKCRTIQESVKDNLLVMYGIVAGAMDGKFIKFDDFVFNPLEEATEKELAENIKSYAEVASALVELGAKQEQVFDWLKGFKQFHLDNLEMDLETENLDGYEDITPEVLAEFKAENEKWITVHPNGGENKGRPLLLDDGESPKEAIKRAWGVDLDKGKKEPEIKIVKETKKALLIRKGDKETWIQRRWMRADGTLTAAAEKSLQEAKTDAQKEQERKEEKERRERGVPRPEKADYESEKAYGYDLTLDFYDAEKTRRHRIFIPKSVIQPNGNIPTWILEKKIQEMEDQYDFNRYGGFSIEHHPFKGMHLGKRDWMYLDEEDDNDAKVKNSAVELTSNEIYTIIDDELCISTDNGETFNKA